MNTPAAGWYPDPGGSGRQRYWDGAVWTERLRNVEDGPTAGWYPDPVDDRLERFWDGVVWTGRTRPSTTLPPPDDPAMVPAGWYPDPFGDLGDRYWDGLSWTDQFVPTVTESAQPATPTSPVPATSSASGSAPEVEGSGRSRQRGAVVALLSVAGILLVVGTAVAMALGLPFGDPSASPEEPESAADGPDVAGDPDDEGGDAAEADADDGAQDDDADHQEAITGTGEPLERFDPAAGQLVIDVGEGPQTVELADGTGQLDDGRPVRLVDDLVLDGDVTGDGGAELVVVVTVGEDENAQTALAVMAEHPEHGAHPVGPPVVVIPTWDVPFTAGPARPRGLAIVDGGIELGLQVPVPEVASTAVQPGSGQRVDVELRLEWTDEDTWLAGADGPVTRMARSLLPDTPADATLVCFGRPVQRGDNPVCRTVAGDDADVAAVQVSMLAVDDDGGVRTSIGAPDTIHTARQVSQLMGDGNHLCRDLRDENDRDERTWDLPFAAMAYWFGEGRPERMDANHNDVPCETVWDGLVELLSDADVRLGEDYTAVVAD